MANWSFSFGYLIWQNERKSALYMVLTISIQLYIQ